MAGALPAGRAASSRRGRSRLHHAAIAADPDRFASYRALADLYRAGRRRDRLWCVAATLTFLRKADDELREIYERGQGRRTGAAPTRRICRRGLGAGSPTPTRTADFSSLFAVLGPVLAGMSAVPPEQAGAAPGGAGRAGAVRRRRRGPGAGAGGARAVDSPPLQVYLRPAERRPAHRAHRAPGSELAPGAGAGRRRWRQGRPMRRGALHAGPPAGAAAARAHRVRAGVGAGGGPGGPGGGAAPGRAQAAVGVAARRGRARDRRAGSAAAAGRPAITSWRRPGAWSPSTAAPSPTSIAGAPRSSCRRRAPLSCWSTIWWLAARVAGRGGRRRAAAHRQAAAARIWSASRSARATSRPAACWDWAEAGRPALASSAVVAAAPPASRRALCVVDKPSGIVVHRGWADDDGGVLVAGCAAQLGRRVWPVHRLDRGASGVAGLRPRRRGRRRAGRASPSGRRATSATWRWCAAIPPAELVIDHPIPGKRGRRRGCRRVTEIRRLGDLGALRPGRGRALAPGGCTRSAGTSSTSAARIIGDVNYGKGEHNRLFRERFGLHRLALHALR